MKITEPPMAVTVQDSTVERAVIVVEYEDNNDVFVIGAPDGMDVADATVFANGLLLQWKEDCADTWGDDYDTPSPYEYLEAHGFVQVPWSVPETMI